MSDKVLAVVNGKEITEDQLNYTLSKFPADRQRQFQTEQGKKELLDQIIAFEAIYQYALDTKMDESEAYKRQVEVAKHEILTQYALSNFLAGASVSEEEAKDFYEANKDLFKDEESVRASHILVDTEALADEIVGKVRRGMDFAEAAAEYSTCPSKSAGGDLGYFTRGRMVPEFENAAFDLNVDEVSEPVETQFGFHVIKLVDRKPSVPKEFDVVKQSIMDNIIGEKQNKIYIDLVNKLKETYNVQYK